MEAIQAHSQHRYAQVWTLFDIIISERDHIIAHCEEKHFSVKLIAIFRSIHVRDVRAETFDFNDKLDTVRYPSKIGKVGAAAPIGHFEFRMEMFEATMHRPPNISKEQYFRVLMASFQSVFPFAFALIEMMLKKLAVLVFEMQWNHPLHKKTSRNSLRRQIAGRSSSF